MEVSQHVHSVCAFTTKIIYYIRLVYCCIKIAYLLMTLALQPHCLGPKDPCFMFKIGVKSFFPSNVFYFPSELIDSNIPPLPQTRTRICYRNYSRALSLGLADMAWKNITAFQANFIHYFLQSGLNMQSTFKVS